MNKRFTVKRKHFMDAFHGEVYSLGISPRHGEIKDGNLTTCRHSVTKTSAYMIENNS